MPRTYRNRVFNSSDEPVYWYSSTPDSAGTYYPGAGTFGVDTSDFSAQEVFLDDSARWLSRAITSTSTSSSGEEDLASVTLLQNSQARYSLVKVSAAGTKAGSNGNKTLKFYFGASPVEFHPAANDEIVWQFDGEILMEGASVHRMTWNGRHVSLTHGIDEFTDDLSAGDLTLKITGNCANASDTITQTSFIVELV